MATKCLNRGKKFRVHLSGVIFIRNILLGSMDKVVGCFLVIGCWMIISFETISFLFAKILIETRLGCYYPAYQKRKKELSHNRCQFLLLCIQVKVGCSIFRKKRQVQPYLTTGFHNKFFPVVFNCNTVFRISEVENRCQENFQSMLVGRHSFYFLSSNRCCCYINRMGNSSFKK